MKDRKLTITIPVYERYEYFEEALLSAVNQTIPVSIIVVDNASSHNKFENYVNNLNLENVSYFRNDTNLGLFGNWNRCIELCQTEFVMILCSDDLLSPWYSTCFYEKLLQYPKISCFHSKISRFGIDEGLNNGHNTKIIVGLHSGLDLLKYQTKNGLASIEPNTIAFSKITDPKFKFEFTNYAYNQDWLFCYTNFTNEKMYGMDRVLYEKRESELSFGIQNHLHIPLGLALIHDSIKNQLKNLKIKEYRLAERNEKWVLRNHIINQNYSSILELIGDHNNPFAVQIQKNLSNDFLSKLSLSNENLFLRKLIRLYLRILRKFNF